jgi:preprotein translocase subunit SecF
MLMGLQFFKPDMNVNFMGAKKYFIIFSICLTILSLIAVSVKGFNLGIDFKGGTKILVSFKKEADIDRKEITRLINDLIEKQTGEKGTQVEVQEFDVGGGNAEETTLQVFTELSSLLTPLKKLEIGNKIKAEFGAGTTVDSSYEAGDKFYVTLKDEMKPNDFNKRISELFRKLNYPSIVISSEKEERIKIDQFKEKNLLFSEEGDKAAEKLEKLNEELNSKLALITDKKYTVVVNEIKDSVNALLKAKYKDNFNEVISATSVSESVGKELFGNGLLAVLYACLGILIYLAVRFDIRYSPGAVIALFHDTIITMGFITIVDIKFTLAIVAVLLTIIGYSVNDTVIVYDRIRENLGKGKWPDLEKVMNMSINQTMSRTIITSFTTFLAIFPLTFLGGGTIQDFAITMCFGIVFGTYSSVFVATPLTLYLDRFFTRRGIKI